MKNQNNTVDNRVTVMIFICNKCSAPNRLGGFPCWHCKYENKTFESKQFLIDHDYLQAGIIKDELLHN